MDKISQGLQVNILSMLLIVAIAVQSVFAAGQTVAVLPSDGVLNGMVTDKRDGKKYKTVKIGSQTWMAENLNYDASGSKCYENKPANCEKYGRLYNWATAKSACSSGWHLPSDGEYETLNKYVGGEKVSGKKLKAKSGWNSYQGKSGNGTDEFGFSALPGGYGHSSGDLYIVGYSGYWWSATESNANYAYYRYMSYYGDSVDRGDNFSKSGLFSVRCVQD